MEQETRTEQLIMLLVTFFFGIFGIHYFVRRQYGLGILYFFTFGLFGIGWLVDVIRAFIALFQPLDKPDYSENFDRRSDYASREVCRRCQKPLSSSRAGKSVLCPSCEDRLSQEYIRISKHFSSLIDEVDRGYARLDTYLRNFPILLNDVDEMELMADDLEMTPPFHKRDLIQALDRKFEAAVEIRLHKIAEKAELDHDRNKLIRELTTLCEELIDCKYNYPDAADKLAPTIQKIKNELSELKN